MGPPVYSTRFLAGVGVTSPLTYVVSPGFRVVLRDVDVYNGGSISSPGAFFLEGELGQTIWQVELDNTHGSSWTWRGRQVFYAGDSFLFRADGPCDVTASGYLFADPG